MTLTKNIIKHCTKLKLSLGKSNHFQVFYVWPNLVNHNKGCVSSGRRKLRRIFSHQKRWPGIEPRSPGLWSQCATILPRQLLILNAKKLKLWRAWAVKTKGTEKWHLQTLIQRDLKKKMFCPYNVFVYIFLSRFLMLNGYSFPKTILNLQQ